MFQMVIRNKTSLINCYRQTILFNQCDDLSVFAPRDYHICLTLFAFFPGENEYRVKFNAIFIMSY